jgi:isopenicillin N synthase-like dioxygenase
MKKAPAPFKPVSLGLSGSNGTDHLTSNDDVEKKEEAVDDGSEDDGWVDAPFVPGTIVVNLGDALEHLTGGLLRATPHR